MPRYSVFDGQPRISYTVNYGTIWSEAMESHATYESAKAAFDKAVAADKYEHYRIDKHTSILETFDHAQPKSDGYIDGFWAASRAARKRAS